MFACMHGMQMYHSRGKHTFCAASTAIIPLLFTLIKREARVVYVRKLFAFKHHHDITALISNLEEYNK